MKSVNTFLWWKETKYFYKRLNGVCLMKKSQTKSKDRIADFGEVFTAEREVNAMHDLLEIE